MANLSKPFVFGISVDSKHFIGREKEIERLSANFRYGVNTIMISPRRIGKTSLVKQVSKTIEDKNIKIVHLDIFSCRSEYDFLNMFASALLQQTSSHADEWKQNIRDFLARVTPKITLSPDPTQEFSISLGITPKTYKPEEILNLPQLIAEKRGYHIVMCIDEFQQIGDFPDSLTVQKKMRTIWQHQQNVSYCLYGSKKNMMSALFQQQSKPFYKFGQIMTLDTIPTETWVPYICSRFATEGKTIPEDIAAEICSMVNNHSSYVQELAYNTLLRTRESVTTMANLQSAFNDLLDDNTTYFIEKTEKLTSYQLNFIRAIIDGVHNNFGIKEVREDYHLGSPSNIVRIKTALQEREIIDINDKGTFISDPVMEKWMQSRFEWC